MRKVCVYLVNGTIGAVALSGALLERAGTRQADTNLEFTFSINFHAARSGDDGRIALRVASDR